MRANASASALSFQDTHNVITLQTDSLTEMVLTEEELAPQAVHVVKKLDGAITRGRNGLTPAQIIARLPKDATEEQKDSAIQANFIPKRTFVCERPDTLHLPGMPAPKPFIKNVVPDNLGEFDIQEHPALKMYPMSESLGKMAMPRPYAIGRDSVAISILIATLLIVMVIFSRSFSFMSRESKRFFYSPKNERTNVSVTNTERHLQFFMMLLTSASIAFIIFFYIVGYSHALPQMSFTEGGIRFVAIYTACAISYFILQSIIYVIVNWVFFQPMQRMLWRQTKNYLVSVEGLLLFPVVLLQIFAHIEEMPVLYYALTVIIIAKLMAFYKCFAIFFKRNSLFLQFFLYFCALEIMPLIGFVALTTSLTGFLKIEY